MKLLSRPIPQALFLGVFAGIMLRSVFAGFMSMFLLVLAALAILWADGSLRKAKDDRNGC